ncbi:hypothetical protein OC834_007882, partial [Tilletia horrida]
MHPRQPQVAKRPTADADARLRQISKLKGSAYYEQLRLHIEDTTGLSLPVEWDVWTPARWADYMERLRDDDADRQAELPPQKPPAAICFETRRLAFQAACYWLTGSNPRGDNAKRAWIDRTPYDAEGQGRFERNPDADPSTLKTRPYQLLMSRRLDTFDDSLRAFERAQAAGKPRAAQGFTPPSQDLIRKHAPLPDIPRRPIPTVQAAVPIEAGDAAHALHHPDEPLDFHHDMSDSSTCPSTSTAPHDSSSTLPPKLSAPPTSKVRDLKRSPVSKQAARRLKKRLANLQEH